MTIEHDFDEVLGVLPISDDDPIRKAFEAFHSQNPHIYDELKRRAFMLLNAGVVQRFSVSMIYDAMRFDNAVKTLSTDIFKLNDHYTALYARKLLDENPSLMGKLTIRRRRGE